MIKLQFSALENQSSGFKNTFLSRENEYLRPTEQDITPKTSEFNGQTYVIQQISYDAYTCNFYLRDQGYSKIQKINSSNYVTIWEIGDEKRFNGVNFELIEITPEPFGREFWKVKLTLRHIASKNIENVIDQTIDDTLVIWNQEAYLFSCNVPFPYIDHVAHEDNLIENVEIRIPDYARNQYYKEINLYLNESDRLSFYQYISNVSPLSVYRILYKSANFSQFEIESDELIGTDLFEIKLRLNSSIVITSP